MASTGLAVMVEAILPHIPTRHANLQLSLRLFLVFPPPKSWDWDTTSDGAYELIPSRNGYYRPAVDP